TTQLACADFAHVEANISKGVTSRFSLGSSSLNIDSVLSNQHFKPGLQFSDFTLVRQLHILSQSSYEDPTKSVAEFPPADIHASTGKIKYLTIPISILRGAVS
ncbi:MAG: hypothetical protein KGH69_05225, partial [Candidatus Micrarchaeota archaeon]|nr:hypothetical protein [Candidatus Micrarchaeota archaeon]